tara:strand:- start:536 stop:652 length:117 start_codon:yes stop_codon:yes gene_type:complete
MPEIIKVTAAMLLVLFNLPEILLLAGAFELGSSILSYL